MAIAAILLWIGGIEVGPNLHVALHAGLAPHVHDAATGAIVRVSFARDSVAAWPHTHADGTTHAHAHAPKTPRGSAHRLAAALDAPHLHAIVAWCAPPPPLAHPVAVDRVATRLCARAPGDPHACTSGRAVARGPPFATLG